MSTGHAGLQRVVGTTVRTTGWLSFYLLLLDALGIHWWSTRPGVRLVIVFGAAFAYGVLDMLTQVVEQWWRRRTGNAAPW